jgi:hypothetical protein
MVVALRSDLTSEQRGKPYGSGASDSPARERSASRRKPSRLKEARLPFDRPPAGGRDPDAAELDHLGTSLDYLTPCCYEPGERQLPEQFAYIPSRVKWIASGIGHTEVPGQKHPSLAAV